jgi:DNA-directed RNA polymerase specialized sigma24 family protein
LVNDAADPGRACAASRETESEKSLEACGRGWISAEVDENEVDMVVLDSALTELEAHRPDMYQVVMLRSIAGLPFAEVGVMLTISASTVKHRWAVARLWLLDRVQGNEPDA